MSEDKPLFSKGDFKIAPDLEPGTIRVETDKGPVELQVIDDPMADEVPSESCSPHVLDHERRNFLAENIAHGAIEDWCWNHSENMHKLAWLFVIREGLQTHVVLADKGWIATGISRRNPDDEENIELGISIAAVRAYKQLIKPSDSKCPK